MVITIGRQFGSGGSEIGRRVAEQLGIPYYDKNMIDDVANRLGLSPQYVSQVEEKPTGSFLYTMAMSTYGAITDTGVVPAELQISTAQTEFILEQAEKGDCVIVGRCADYILKSRTDVINVFIYGEMQDRIKTVMERYNLSEREAVRTIAQTDKRRAMYYNTNTQRRWGSRESYHLLLDSSRFGIDGAVNLICAAFQAEK